jgi:hypothetical protein
VNEWTKPLKVIDVLRYAAAACALAVGVVVSADPQTKMLRVTSEDMPTGALRMTLAVLLIAAFYFWGGIINARRHRFASHAPETADGRPKLRRAPHSAGFNLLLWQLLLCGWLMAIAYPEQWTWASIGLKTQLPIALSAAIGFALYLALFVSNPVAVRLGGDRRFLDEAVRSMAAIVPRGRGQKAMAWMALCVLNPVIEEVLFRGVLVYQTGLVLGSPWLPIAAGLVVNIGNHWYQGPRSMLLHIPFYAVAVALLYSPLGLVGAIGLHVAGDVVPMWHFRRNLRRFRERHRASRGAPSPEELAQVVVGR